MYAFAAFFVIFADSRAGLDHQAMLGIKNAEAGNDLVGNKKRKKKKAERT